MKPVSEMNEAQQRVAQALVSSGRRGIERDEFEQTPTFDGGSKIKRLAARIGELEHEFGFDIGRPGKRNGNQIYTLLREPSRVVAKRPLVHGFQRRFVCVRCLGNVMYPEQACGTARPVLEPSDQVVTGCRKAREVEHAQAA